MLGYRVSGVRVRSDIQLDIEAAAPVEVANEPVVTLRHAERSPAATWFFEQPPWLRVGRLEGGGYVLRIEGQAEFVVRGATVTWTAQDGCPEETVAQLFVDHVLPQVLHTIGRFALHGSAVAIEGRALALLGKTGAGKSTLAASLARSASLVADDCIAIEVRGEVVMVFPSYPAVRLLEDSARALARERPARPASPRTAKLRVELPGVSDDNIPLGAVCILDASAPPGVERMKARDAVVQLANHVHRLDPLDPELLEKELSLLAAVAERVPVYRAGLPRGFDRLPSVGDMLVRTCA